MRNKHTEENSEEDVENEIWEDSPIQLGMATRIR